MMQSENFQHSFNMDVHVGDFEFSSSFTNTEKDSNSDPLFSSMLSDDQFLQFPDFIEDLKLMSPGQDFGVLDMEFFDPIFHNEIEGLDLCLEESIGSFPSQQSSPEVEDHHQWSPTPSPSLISIEGSIDTSQTQSSLVFPSDEIEIDPQLSTFHLLKAYGEAMEREETELADVIIRCLAEKVSPIGSSLERLAFHLSSDSSQDITKQGCDYLSQESVKNFDSAFKVFYEMFPYGRFAHFAANSAILGSMPDDAETIHIVDFDIGEGVQWPPVIEAIAKRHKTLKLTSLKWEDHKFEDKKRLLCDSARQFGLNFVIKEMGIEELLIEIKRVNKRGGRRREWLAFNCMAALPHMAGGGKSGKLVMEFVKVAKELLSGSMKNNGVVVVGDGDPREKLKYCGGFEPFFNGHLVHYQALLESMESNFPTHLGEARMAMEWLFVKPLVSYLAWSRKWEEMREGQGFEAEKVLESCEVRRESLMEAKSLVREGESLYGVRLGGESGNEMVLEWRGTPLVRVSTWRSQS